MKIMRNLCVLCVLCGGALLSSSSVLASSPKFFQASTQTDFLKGDVENLSIDGRGQLLLGPALDLVYETPAPFVWTIVAAPDGSFFLGCNSPEPVVASAGDGWQRLRWGGNTPLLAYSATSGQLVPVTGAVQSLSIVFDEGQDAGSDNFGLAVLDNVDVNGTLVGQGPTTPN